MRGWTGLMGVGEGSPPRLRRVPDSPLSGGGAGEPRHLWGHRLVSSSLVADAVCQVDVGAVQRVAAGRHRDDLIDLWGERMGGASQVFVDRLATDPTAVFLCQHSPGQLVSGVPVGAARVASHDSTSPKEKGPLHLVARTFRIQ